MQPTLVPPLIPGNSEPEFHPHYADLPVRVLLATAETEDINPIRGLTITYHPNLLYSWVVADRYEPGFATAEEATKDALIQNGLDKFATTEQFPVLVDGLIQYLAYLDTYQREDRDEFFTPRIADLSCQYAQGLFKPREGFKLAYQWTPIPVWRLPSTPLREAVLQHRTLRFQYTNQGNDLTSTRVVEPHYVFDARTTGNRCLLSWCRLRNNWRSFLVDRINLLNVGKKFDFVERTVRAEVEESLYKASQIAQEGPLDAQLL